MIAPFHLDGVLGFSVLSLGVFACQYITLLQLSMSLKKVNIQKIYIQIQI